MGGRATTVPPRRRSAPPPWCSHQDPQHPPSPRCRQHCQRPEPAACDTRGQEELGAAPRVCRGLDGAPGMVTARGKLSRFTCQQPLRAVSENHVHDRQAAYTGHSQTTTPTGPRKTGLCSTPTSPTPAPLAPGFPQGSITAEKAGPGPALACGTHLATSAGDLGKCWGLSFISPKVWRHQEGVPATAVRRRLP